MSMKIRPVSDLRNKFPEIEAELKENGAIYFTKNGYGTAVLMDIDKYADFNESSLRLADKNKHSSNTSSTKTGLGFLSEYANSDKIKLEKIAGKLHALKKFGGVSNE